MVGVVILQVQLWRAAVLNQVSGDIDVYGFVPQRDVGIIQRTREQPRTDGDDDDQQYPRNDSPRYVRSPRPDHFAERHGG
jgi:hypothetical protein